MKFHSSYIIWLIVNEYINSATQTQKVFIPDYCETASYCDNREPCSKHGNCYVDIFKYYNKTGPNLTSSCQCNKGWKTTNDDTVKCCYQRKMQYVALLLEFAVGFGTGHFYAGNSVRGVIKFSAAFMLLAVFCLTGFLSCYREGNYEIGRSKQKENNNNNIISTMLIYGSLICFFTYQIIDTVLFGLNFYTDGNDHELEPW